MQEFLSPERQFTLSESLSGIIDMMSNSQWNWSVSTQSLVNTNIIDTICNLALDKNSSEQSRGKGCGLESLASGLYELLEHAIYSQPTLQQDLNTEKNLLRIQGDILLDSISSESKNTDLLFSNMQTKSFATLPPEFCGGKSTGEFSSRTESLIRCYYTNNGWASGSSIEEATLHAINELIERDATSFALLSNITESPYGEIIIPKGTVLTTLRDSIVNQTKTKLVIVSVPAISGYVVLSISYSHDETLPPHIGCGASQSIGYATYRSLLELWQEFCADSDEPTKDEIMQYQHIKEMIHFYPNLGKALFFQEVLNAKDILTKQYVDYSSKTDRSFPSISEQIQKTIADCMRNGLNIYRRIPFHSYSTQGKCAPCVVQIVIPGLERFHVIRHGFPAEVIGRFRNPRILETLREQNNFNSKLK